MRRLIGWFSGKLSALSDWALWSAWNHARKMAWRRRSWVPGEAKQAASDDSPESVRIRGNEARQLLENKHFLGAWESLNATLEMQALSCDVDNESGREKAVRIVISKQLLHGMRREIERKLDDGYMAEIQLDELRAKNAPRRYQR